MRQGMRGSGISKYQKAQKAKTRQTTLEEELEDVKISLTPEAFEEENRETQVVSGLDVDAVVDEAFLEQSADGAEEVELPPLNSVGSKARNAVSFIGAMSEKRGPSQVGRFDRLQDVDQANKEEIIREYAPLIKYIAQKIAARLPANIELDDLISAGVIGLMDAIEKYDPTRDNKFKTYAEFRVRGAILDELRSQDWVPRSVREKSKQLERALSKIEQEKGRPAKDEEVCAELRLKPDEYFEMLGQVRSVALLSYEDISSFSRSDRKSALGLGEGTKAPTPFSEINSATLKKVVADAIKELPEKQRLVLSLYYYEDLNLKEIGRVLDVTESRVSQLHTQAVLKLKAKLKGHFEDFLALF